MNIVFLMGGENIDHKGDSYPIYMAEMNEEIILEKQIAHYRKMNPGKMVFCVRKEDIKNFSADSVIQQSAEKAVCVEICGGMTAGSVCTALLASEHIDNEEELVLVAIDELIESDPVTMIESFRKEQCDAGVVSFRSVHPRYSFARTDSSGHVCEVAEKKPVSKNALASFYYFKNGHDFVECAKSVVRKDSGRNLFSNEDGTPSKEFYWFIGGLQRYIPAAMALFAPYVNSYRRLARFTAAPINIQWGTDNRTVGIRSPVASPAARRIENRVIGADANPYVALAATLACGYLGMKNRIEPTPECKGDAYLSEYQLPRSLSEALGWLADEKDLHDVLGKEFITVYSEIKEIEYAEFMKVISPWEREHLLLHV